jgi:hypothetical protein
MARDTIDVQLLQEERALILKYGYPFEKIKSALRQSPDDHIFVTVAMPTFELNKLIGDLCRSVNHDEVPRSDFDAVNELIDRLEFTERTGDGVLDIFY